jgi:hypothetical protein
MTWKDNSLIWLRTGATTYEKLSDHNRSPLSEDPERIETKKRMADGTLRRYSIVKKRTFSCSWDLLPSSNAIAGSLKTVDGGMAGEDLERIYNTINNPMRMVIRRGSAINLPMPNPTDAQLPFSDANFYVANVMISEFSKEVVKRGKVDLWNVSLTLEEV